MDVPDHLSESGLCVPGIFGRKYAEKRNYGQPLGRTKAKKLLSNAFSCMTAELLYERDPDGEVAGWFNHLNEILEA